MVGGRDLSHISGDGAAVSTSLRSRTPAHEERPPCLLHVLSYWDEVVITRACRRDGGPEVGPAGGERFWGGGRGRGGDHRAPTHPNWDFIIPAVRTTLGPIPNGTLSPFHM